MADSAPSGTFCGHQQHFSNTSHAAIPLVTATTVRHATAADAQDIARLIGQLGYPFEASDAPRRLANMTHAGRAVVLLAEHHGSVVGLVTSHILSVINREHDVAWLTTLVIDETVRGSGVGRILVQAVEQFARDAGCERLTVTTHVHRSDAHAFYEKLGFELTGRRYGKAFT